MSCIIKLKVGNEYRIFDTEDQLKLFLSEHQDEIEDWEVRSKTDKNKTEKKPFLTVANQNAAIAKIINDANHEAFEATKELLDKEDMDDFDRAKFKQTSKTLSMSEVLKEFRAVDSNGREYRLFPEFIVANYLNMLKLDLIIEKIKSNNSKLTHELVINSIVNKNNGNGLTGNTQLSTEEIVEMLINVADDVCNQEEIDKLNSLHEDNVAINEITYQADVANQQNFDVMIRGEIMHNILHTYVENIGKYKKDRRSLIEKIKNDLKKSGNKNLRQSFHDKYDNDDSMLLGNNVARNHIESICDQCLDDDLLIKYIDEIEKGIEKIEEKFKGKQVMLISEKRITSKLNDGMEISGKNLLIGKPDLIVLVDGVPHIVDLKCSRKTINEWSEAKKLKTQYQLGMYKRMINRIGIDNSGAQTYVLAINIDNDGKVGQSELRQFNQISNINRNLDGFFKNVDYETTLSKNEFVKIDEAFDKAIGVATHSGHKVLSEEAVKEKLRSNVHKKRNGKYVINYVIFDSDKGYDVQKKWDDIDEDKIEDTINIIAKQIVNSRVDSIEARYKTLTEDLSK